MAGNTSHIRLRGIGLDFTLFQNKSFTLREMLLHSFMLRGHTPETFSALRGIDLEINHGERVAFIGPNGAGKSSLLKVIAGIYPASAGSADIQGRVTPLIEMGAGFHQELTGRENLFLNGAILGANRAEMQQRLPKILEFSEITETFLDTPIKYYSSGMKTRLAFSIAMEVAPEILILDEIFSNADVHFVEKASKRLASLIGAAHIVILVTHDLELARKIATRCIWFEKGKIFRDGPIGPVLGEYDPKNSEQSSTTIHEGLDGHEDHDEK